MAHATVPTPRRQVAHTCQQLHHHPGLPFADHLPAQRIEQTLRSLGHTFRHRLFCPALTLWTFLSQVLDPDHSCRAAVARVLAWRVRRGLPPCSADTGAYCKARQRLPQELLAQLTRDTGHEGLSQAAPAWCWQGRPVKVVDGTGLSMPDTKANRKHYPPSRQARPGCGFPLMRLVVLFSLAVGTVLDAAFSPHRGQGTGELSLWRTLEHGLQAGDVLLADRGFCCFWTLAQAQARGADAVLRLHQGWIKDARWGRRLGAGSRGLRLLKPTRPAWLEAADYQALPEQLHLRTVAVRVRQRGFRTKRLIVVTTLLDPVAVPASALAELYRMRWQVELDLRSLKQTLQMDILRGRTPDLVAKEVWAHFLAYNVVRLVMAQAARRAGLSPRQLSVAGAVQQLTAFGPHLREAGSAAEVLALWEALWVAVGRQRVVPRPNRIEPRAVKRRGKAYPYLGVPRRQSRKRLKAVG
jgi:hypothetical protein